MGTLSKLQSELAKVSNTGPAFLVRRMELRRAIATIMAISEFTDDCLLLGYPDCPSRHIYGAQHIHGATEQTQ